MISKDALPDGARIESLVIRPGRLDTNGYNFEDAPLNGLAMEIYQWGIRKGWNEDLDLAEKLLLIHSEISEAFEHYRNGFNGADIVYHRDGKPDGIGIELIDAMIRILHLCAILGLDVDHLMGIKMAYNETRAYRHGNKKA